MLLRVVHNSYIANLIKANPLNTTNFAEIDYIRSLDIHLSQACGIGSRFSQQAHAAEESEST